MRVSDIDLWEAPLAFVGQATARCSAKLEGAEVPYALLVDSDRRPLGWLSRAGPRRADRPEARPTPPDPILDLDDVLRDALADILQSETQYAPVVDGAAPIAGVLSVEIISDFLASPRRPSWRSTRQPSARWLNGDPATEPPDDPGRRSLPLIAQADDSSATGAARPTCVAEQRDICFGLGDRQLRPLRRPRPWSTSCWW